MTGNPDPGQIEELVARWQAHGHWERPEPRPKEEVRSFLETVHNRFGFELPPDYARFLELSDGGQFNSRYLFGIEWGGGILNRCRDLKSDRLLLIGEQGNVEVYALSPEGRCEVIDFPAFDHVFESYPSFTAFLTHLVNAT
jgi:hypothetical protein